MENSQAKTGAVRDAMTKMASPINTNRFMFHFLLVIPKKRNPSPRADSSDPLGCKRPNRNAQAKPVLSVFVDQKCESVRVFWTANIKEGLITC